MTWTDRTGQERADLRKRRAARRERKQRHVAALWDDKARRLHGDRDKAAFQFDLARRHIESGPEEMRATRYRVLAGLLRQFTEDLGGDGR